MRVSSSVARAVIASASLTRPAVGKPVQLVSVPAKFVANRVLRWEL
jgi:hypothetical protein